MECLFYAAIFFFLIVRLRSSIFGLSRYPMQRFRPEERKHLLNGNKTFEKNWPGRKRRWSQNEISNIKKRTDVTLGSLRASL